MPTWSAMRRLPATNQNLTVTSSFLFQPMSTTHSERPVEPSEVKRQDQSGAVTQDSRRRMQVDAVRTVS